MKITEDNENLQGESENFGNSNELSITNENECNRENFIEQKGEKGKKTFSVTNYMQLVAHTLYLVTSVFVSTFLVSHIYSISSNYMVSIGIFYAGNYFAMAVVYLIFSYLIDRTNRVIFYRISLVVKAVFLALLIFYGEKLAALAIVAGVLNGVSDGLYWMSYNLMKNELVRKSSAKKYSVWQSILEKSVNVIIPVTLGKIIDTSSFESSAIIIAVVVAFELVASFFIKSKRPEGSVFSFRELQDGIKAQGERGKLIKYMLTFSFIYGLANAITQTETIIIMIGFGSNLSLGTVTSIASAISILFVILINKLTPGKRDWTYILNATLPLFASIICAVLFNQVTIVIFAFLFKVLQHSYTVTFDISRNLILKKMNMYNSIAEYQCAVECLMGLSRTIIYSVMAVFGLVGACFGESGLFLSVKIYLIFSVALMSFVSLYYMWFEKKLAKEQIV